MRELDARANGRRRPWRLETLCKSTSCALRSGPRRGLLREFYDDGRADMFQAIVHAPTLRPGARLCLSDLAQTSGSPPVRLSAGDAVALRFGVCCPDHGMGAITDVRADIATLRVAGARWRLHRCPAGGGVDVPGLVGENWFVMDRTD